MTATEQPRATGPVPGRLGFLHVGRLSLDAVDHLETLDSTDTEGILHLLAPLIDGLASTHEPVGIRRIKVEPGTAQPFWCTPTIVRPGDCDVYELIVATSSALGHSGQLRLRPSFARAIRPIDDGERFRARARRAVPLDIGEALLLSEGVGWSTYPNNTEQPTSFVVVTLVQRGSRLTLVRRRGNGRLEAIESLRAAELQQHLDRGTVPERNWQPLQRPGSDMKATLNGVGAVATDAVTVSLAATLRGIRDPQQVVSQAIMAGRDTKVVRRLAELTRAGRASHDVARSAGTPRLGAAIEGALTVADTLVDQTGTSGVPRWVSRMHAHRSVWTEEFGDIEGELDLPPASFLLGIDDGSSSTERRLVLMHEGHWIERSVERAPWTSDALRRVRGLIGASFVDLLHNGPLVADPDLRGASTMALIPLDGEQVSPLVFDRRSVPKHIPAGSYLLVEVADTGSGPARRVAGLTQRLRPWRAGASWVDHRILQWDARDQADEEPPEGVLVEQYEDFAGENPSIRMLFTSKGRAAAFDAATIPCIMALVRVNNWLLSRHLRGTPAMWDHARFPWAPGVEAAWDDIRREVEQLMRSHQWVPTVREVVGLESEPDHPAVGSTHEWRNFILYHRGHWMDWNCEQCPRTTEVVKGIPGLNFAFFSILEPGGHIVRHRGPNRGALRHHVGIVIPDPPGSCVIEINGVDRYWEEGSTLMFDLTSEHEVWNRSDSPRVLLMCEVNTPLPIGLSTFNRLTQAVYSELPPFRRMKTHLKSVEQPSRTAPREHA